MKTTARNDGIVSALSKHLSGLSLDPRSEKLAKVQAVVHFMPRLKKQISGKVSEEQDIANLFSSILQLTGGVNSIKNKDEVMKWVKFANDFSSDTKTRDSALNSLNEELACRSVILGNGYETSEADIIVYSALHSFVFSLSKSHMLQIPNVMRWMDYVQNKEDFDGAFEKVVVGRALFHPPEFSSNSDQNPKKSNKPSGVTGKAADPEPKTSAEGKTSGDSKSTEEIKNVEKLNDGKKKASTKASEEQKKVQAKETAEKNVEVSVSSLNIQVGVIRKAWKHPSADSLLVEEIDLGDGNVRQVVSGLAKYCSPEDLTNRRVALITNVKPGKLRDVMSSGLVLCASNQDQTVVEPLLPPENSIPGERITFSGYEGKPEDVLNPKKKQLEKITPDLYTDDNGIATYKGVPFMTLAGPCRSSIPKATIK